jgi:hypothetical protein
MNKTFLLGLCLWISALVIAIGGMFRVYANISANFDHLMIVVAFLLTTNGAILMLIGDDHR